MKSYDIIIAGGGAAGLSLAYYLSLSDQFQRNVLIIDRDTKNRNDRTWGFWHRQPIIFNHLISRRFHQLEFISTNFERKFDIFPYQYSIIRGIDFYRHIQEHLRKFPQFQFLQANILRVTDQSGYALVNTDQGEFQAEWVFSSLYNEQEILKAVQSGLYLRQHFKGWFIRTSQPVFDPTSFRMFDFRTPQNGLMRFFYVIPWATNEALVEYTLFSENLLSPEEYDFALKNYIRDVLGLDAYEIVDTEFGIIPMTTYRFPVTSGKRIIHIGSAGGNSKPSSGYTFLRIQKHVSQIAHALHTSQSPVIDGNSPRRYRLIDSVLLNILKTRGHLAERIFTQLFSNNNIEHIFQFLDEEGGITNDLRIISSLKPWPFLQSSAEILAKRVI